MTTADRPVDPYPEHAKMHAVVAETQAAGEFVDWLQSQGVVLHEYRKTYGQWRSEDHEDCFVPSRSLTKLLADWKGIDLDAVDREKRAMLDGMRANAQGGPDA